MYTTLCHAYTHITHHTLPLTHRWVSVTIPWTACQAGTITAVVTMLMMGGFTTRVALVLSLVRHAQMETEWVVGWTSVLTAALVMSMCSSQRMGNRLVGRGKRRGRRQVKEDVEQGEENCFWLELTSPTLSSLCTSYAFSLFSFVSLSLLLSLPSPFPFFPTFLSLFHPSSLTPSGWICGENKEAGTWTVSLDWARKQRREGM